jgi:hypothetical protein
MYSEEDIFVWQEAFFPSCVTLVVPRCGLIPVINITTVLITVLVLHLFLIYCVTFTYLC